MTTQHMPFLKTKTVATKGRAAVAVEGGWVVIEASAHYEIELSRCDTPEKILAWVNHLSAKSWITPKLLRDFIEVICEHIGLGLELSARPKHPTPNSKTKS